MCVRRQYHWRRAPSWITKRHYVYYYGATGGCRHAVGAKIVENGVNAIQKWVPFTPKCSQKRWRLGIRPRPPKSEGERFRCLPCSLIRRVENGVNAILKWVPFTPKCSQKRWWLGLRPRPLLARESAFDACQSDTPKGRGANSHLRPGRHKPSVRHWLKTHATPNLIFLQN